MDCESPEVFEQVIRKARKQHRCCECGGAITPGDYYQYAHGIWADGPAGFKTCIPCARLRRDIETEGRRKDCYWEPIALGYLGEYIDCYTGDSEITKRWAEMKSK